MSFASWYNHHYATWNRTRRIHQTPYLARTDSNIARVATNMANPIPTTSPNVASTEDAPSNAKEKKTQDPLFGPNIGVISSGPAWTASSEKKVLTDELTPEVVSGWIEKSKETSQPTTTLQALVNLKRPTIRLSPLTSEEPNPHNPWRAHHPPHGLEFEYDCDAPRSGIYVHVLLPKDHPDAPVTSSPSGLSKLLVYESVFEGGFGKVLKIEDGAAFELERFERMSKPERGPAVIPGSPPPPATTTADSLSPSEAALESSIASPDPSSNRHARRRFTAFHFLRRSEGRSVSGPALAVVDADPGPGSEAKIKDDAMEGVRVMIRLAALDEEATELASPNEQVTYLHIVRFGPKPTEEQAQAEEDTRPWVVKVVKREATIGPHTFHLHEIYGLTSAATNIVHAPTAPLPSSPDQDNHTYPPTSPPLTTVADASEDDPSSECLLCLSSPREVVLLPCRHLVACKECALNMVEFGAGGNITQSESAAPAADGGEAQAGENSGAASDGAASVTPAPPVTPARRKRKAKGWFCPVCRQPYTSLLRITTTAPPPVPEVEKDVARPSEEVAEASADNASPPAVASEGRRLGGGFAPSFLRGFGLSRGPQLDVESQAGTTRVGA